MYVRAEWAVPGAFPQLTQWTINEQNVHGPLPNGLGLNLPSLQYLDWSGCSLSGDIPKGIFAHSIGDDSNCDILHIPEPMHVLLTAATDLMTLSISLFWLSWAHALQCQLDCCKCC